MNSFSLKKRVNIACITTDTNSNSDPTILSISLPKRRTIESVSTYASSISYRAFGGLKSMTYGSSKVMTNTFNTRLQLASFNVGSTLGSANEYYPDGRLKLADDTYDSRYDRLYQYDDQGRVTDAKSGAKAANEASSTDTGPYQQTYGYTPFDDLSSRTGKLWGTDLSSASLPYTNHRNTSGSWSYDADGRETVTPSDDADHTSHFDASGTRYRVDWPGFIGIYHTATTFYVDQGFDGDGNRLSQKEHIPLHDGLTYQVRSSLLGVFYEITKVGSSVYKSLGTVYLNGQAIAYQVKSPPYYTSDIVTESYENPATGAKRGMTEMEPDTLGVDAGLTPPDGPPDNSGYSDIVFPKFADAFNLASGCQWGGMPISCDQKAATEQADEDLAYIHMMHELDKERAGSGAGSGAGTGTTQNASQGSTDTAGLTGNSNASGFGSGGPRISDDDSQADDSDADDESNSPTKVRIIRIDKTVLFQGKDAEAAIANVNIPCTGSGEKVGCTYADIRVKTPPSVRRNGTYVTASVSVVMTITVTLPKWAGYLKASSTERGKWDVFVSKIREHEDGHVQIDTRGAYTIANSYASSGRTRDVLFQNETQNYKREYAKMRSENRDYDMLHYDVYH